jgi:hypothetical protein
MPPKSSATAKSKAPGRQATVSPDVEESGPFKQELVVAETETQTPRSMDDGFSQRQLETLTSIVKAAV